MYTFANLVRQEKFYEHKEIFQFYFWQFLFHHKIMGSAYMFYIL